MAELIAQAKLKPDYKQLGLWKVFDGTFVVGLHEDVGPSPDLVVGCIGPWLNTDDEVTAFAYYEETVKYANIIH